MSSPILDLSYRNYDGPLGSTRNRWWAIAKMSIKLAFKKKMLWVFTAFSAWYYFGMVFILFIMDQMATQTGGRPGRPNMIEEFFARIIWKDQFVHGLGFGQMLFLIMSLFLGAGTLANDTRANALLVYLSKPVSKLDYIIGKWFGVFLPLLLTMLIPSLFFFFYGAMSYRERGFFSQDPWLILKLLAICPVCAAFHASIVIGFSSMFNQGRLAGASYAGLYFLTNFFTQLMVFTVMAGSGRRGGSLPEGIVALTQKLFYASVDGLNIGLAKAIFGTAGSPYFGIDSRAPMVPSPPLIPTMAIMLAVSFGFIFVAWRRIRAVEVVG